MKNKQVTSDGQVEAVMDVAVVAVKSAVQEVAKKIGKPGCQRILAQGDKFAFDLTAFVIAKMVELAEQIVGYLKIISGGTEISIRATDGEGTFVKEEKLFPGWFDSDFVNYNTNVKGQPTKETLIHVCEMIKTGTFAQIFGGFGENLDRLCLSQDQIICFCRDQAKWLRSDGYGTFFLFKVNGEFFVARVFRRSAGLGVSVYRLSCDDVWCAEYRHRVVVPQL